MIKLRSRSEALPPLPDEYLADPSRYFLEWIPQKLREDRELAQYYGARRAVAQIKLTGERGGTWHFVLGGGDVSVHAGRHPRPSFKVKMSVDTWRRTRRGQRSGLAAFFRRELKVGGVSDHRETRVSGPA